MTPLYGLIVAALIATPLAVPADSPTLPATVPPNAPPGPVADLRPMEVRIRKLYLVRPDLLQFPNPYDVIC